MARGRPRSFDRDEALLKARDLFWARGFEGVTLVDLQGAMGDIGAPSFYAAFGSKEKLFRETVELYGRTEGGAVRRALEGGKTARESVEGVLRAAVEASCRSGMPRGCMMVLSATNCSQANGEVQEFMRERRRAGKKVIKERIERGKREGDVGAGVDAGALAEYIATVLYGLAVQARDGATKKGLAQAAEMAMRAWPG